MPKTGATRLMPPTASLDRLRETASRGLLILLWAHVALVPGLALALGTPWPAPGLLALALAAVPTLSWWRSGSGLATRLTVGVAVVGMVSLIVSELAGHPWQLDAHMYFFATLALLATYCDWQVLLLAAGATALHHLVLNFALPAAIYPGGADLGRVVLHAAIVVLETGALVWLTFELNRLFVFSAAATAAAEAARVAELAARDASAAIDARHAAERQDAARALAGRFEAEVGALVAAAARAASEVSGRSDELSGTAGATAEHTASLVAASRETAHGVDSVASAAEELSASVHEITRSITLAAGVAGRAVAETGRTNAMVRALSQASERIGEVVGLIKGIAAQTNLLALNATIEAARAGEAGKGFSVVAGEVKALAAETARATGEIQSQVDAIRAETAGAATAIGGIAATVAELGGLTASVAATVEQQDHATREIARSIQSAAQGSASVSQNLDALAGSAERTGSAAASCRVAAGELSAQCESVAGAVRGFVSTMREG